MKQRFVWIVFCIFLLLTACGTAKPSAAETTAAAVRTLSPEEAEAHMRSLAEYLLLDVREPSEFAESHLPGAVCIPYTQLEAQQSLLPQDIAYPIFVYCRSGRRSAIAAQTLVSLGYRNVMDIGGIIHWPYEIVSEPSAAEHTHIWEDYDCNYQICTVCGSFQNYS